MKKILKNQYLISNNKINEYSSSECKKKYFLNFEVLYHDNLYCSFSSFKHVNVLLLGYIINSLDPKQINKEIVDELCKSSFNILSLFENLQKYSGRYVIFYKNEKDFIALTDALGFRQIYFTFYDKSLTISSSPKLILEVLNLKPDISEEVFGLINSSKYNSSNTPWIGEYWYDKRIKKVLPNHYLNLNTHEIHRTPLTIKSLSKEETIDFATNVFTGSFDAINRRNKKIVQPLTSGWDSRLLLSASKPRSNYIDYYIFTSNPQTLRSPDVVIANRIAHKLNINFKTILPSQLNEDFKQKYLEFNINPRLLNKTRHIQWHYYENSEKDIINVSGNGAGVIKRFFYYYEKGKEVNFDTLLKCRSYNWFFKSELEKWYEEALPYSRENKISLLILFYWEQMMGQLIAQYLHEQDIAIEEFAPFNNKDLLLTVLQINPEKKEKFNKFIYREIMRRLWPAVLHEPFNPVLGFNLSKRIAVSARKRPGLYSFLKRSKNFIKEF